MPEAVGEAVVVRVVVWMGEAVAVAARATAEAVAREEVVLKVVE